MADQVGSTDAIIKAVAAAPHRFGDRGGHRDPPGAPPQRGDPGQDRGLARSPGLSLLDDVPHRRSASRLDPRGAGGRERGQPDHRPRDGGRCTLDSRSTGCSRSPERHRRQEAYKPICAGPGSMPNPGSAPTATTRVPGSSRSAGGTSPSVRSPSGSGCAQVQQTESARASRERGWSSPPSAGFGVVQLTQQVYIEPSDVPHPDQDPARQAIDLAHAAHHLDVPRSWRD